MAAPEHPHHAFVKRGRIGDRMVRKNRRPVTDFWPHKIKVKFVVPSVSKGHKRTKRIVRLMTCPICGRWWERPVTATFGCSGKCQDEVLKYRYQFRRRR